MENSWGAKIADKGYFTMSDDWFTEYVYEVAVPKALLPEEYQKALEEPATMLPAWDPMAHSHKKEPGGLFRECAEPRQRRGDVESAVGSQSESFGLKDQRA